MKCSVTGRHLEVTPALRQVINRKLERLDRLLNDSVVSAQVVLSLEKYRRVAEVVLHVRGDHMLRGIGQGTSWSESLSAAVEKVSQQAHTLKGKWEKRRRRAAPVKSSVAPAAGGAEAPPRPRILRDARYPVKPMSVQDAASAIGAGNGAFVVFRNSVGGAINVLYRRADGRLALIEPEA